MKYTILLIMLVFAGCSIVNRNCNLDTLDYDHVKLAKNLNVQDTLVMFKYNDCELTNESNLFEQDLNNYLVSADSFNFNRPIILVTFMNSYNDTANFRNMIVVINNLRMKALNKLSLEIYDTEYLKLNSDMKFRVGLEVDRRYGEGPFPRFDVINKEEINQLMDDSTAWELFEILTSWN